jgi:excisionase family DNA binding protein
VTLRDLLEALPPDTHVPAGWVLKCLDQEGLEAPSGDQWLTTKEAAVLLRVSEATIRRRCNARVLDAERQGRSWRIRESACSPGSASADAGDGSRRTRPITRPTDARRRMPADLSEWQEKQAATRAGE